MWNLKCIDFCCYSPIATCLLPVSSSLLRSCLYRTEQSKTSSQNKRIKSHISSTCGHLHPPSHFYPTRFYQKGPQYPSFGGQQKSPLKASIARREQSCHFLRSNSAPPVIPATIMNVCDTEKPCEPESQDSHKARDKMISRQVLGSHLREVKAGLEGRGWALEPHRCGGGKVI